MFRGHKGFTLVEALVATVLAGVGVSGAIMGIASLTKAQALEAEKERMVRLAITKYDDLVATGQATNLGGTFADEGDDRYDWEAAVEPTGTENLSQLTVTVRLTEGRGRNREESISGLVFEEPFSTGATP